MPRSHRPASIDADGDAVASVGDGVLVVRSDTGEIVPARFIFADSGAVEDLADTTDGLGDGNPVSFDQVIVRPLKRWPAVASGLTLSLQVGGVRDTAGNAMSAPATFDFTVEATQPHVTAATPAAASTGVAISSLLEDLSPHECEARKP